MPKPEYCPSCHIHYLDHAGRCKGCGHGYEEGIAVSDGVEEIKALTAEVELYRKWLFLIEKLEDAKQRCKEGEWYNFSCWLKKVGNGFECDKQSLERKKR